jgi:hypothetical protein
MEAWTEVNLVPRKPLDEAVLVEHVDKLVHEQLVDAIAVWFWFWEPDLRLRLRWREPGRVEEHRATLATILDSWRGNRAIKSWYEGAHGRKGETYAGEADHYGEEIWPRLQLSWMESSELALALIKLDREGRLTQPRDYHWNRRVHLFTNQVFQTWEAEVELSLRQARGYARGLGGKVTRESKQLLAELEELVHTSKG